MPNARSMFIERISSLARSSQIDAVKNKALTEKAHNDVARMLRNGLAVVGFTALEDFIKLRTSEVLSEVGNANVPFKDLPERLKFAATFEALSALSYQLSFRDKSDRIIYVQEHAKKISSTAGSVYEITPHAFGYDQANVKEDTVKSILKSFLIDDPWGEMSKLGARLGLVGMPLSETFKGAAHRRHRAAHVAHADTPITDLTQFIKEAYAIAIGFDGLLSKAFSMMQQQDQKFLRGERKIDNTSIKTRVLKQDNGIWKEFVEERKKAYRASKDLETLLPMARTRAVTAANLFVQYDSAGEILSWECN